MTRKPDHFLDCSDYDWTRPEAVELHEILARAYGTKPNAQTIVARAGIERGDVNFEQPPRDFWRQILGVAARSGLVRKLVQKAREDPSIAGYHTRLDRLLGERPSPAEAPPTAERPISWKGNEVITGHQETFLEMSFLHEGLRVAAAVVYLGTVTRGDNSYHGSGFLIAKDTILTNYHVLHDEDGAPVKQVDIWFNYERDIDGKVRAVDAYEGDVATIAGDLEHDWAIIRPRRPFHSQYPLLSLRPSTPVRKGDFVYIIQHPQGRAKKIGLLHNEVVSVTGDRVQYLTDTLPGSSGSPVFNDLWQVVALHHAGIKGDGSPGGPWRNEGVHIDRVVEGLAARGILEHRTG